MENVCPNCGGGFVPRPIRPKDMLDKYPASDVVVFKPIDLKSFNMVLKQKKNVDPKDR